MVWYTRRGNACMQVIYASVGAQFEIRCGRDYILPTHKIFLLVHFVLNCPRPRAYRR